MSERYYLNTASLAKMVVPHDCVIKKIELDDDMITFIFEDDITYHDGMNNKAKSLIIHYHLLNNLSDASLLIQSKRNIFSRKRDTYKKYYLDSNKEKLLNLTNGNLEYLYHNVGYCSLIIKLWAKGEVILDMDCDYVEYDWIN